MGSQDVFKGAMGWDDWIWWSGIGGVSLFVLMLVLCACVCVQRAKRKGREEAMATVQARERERQQQEQAQLRYAQAQQARYPPREQSFSYSKPEPPFPQQRLQQQPPQQAYAYSKPTPPERQPMQPAFEPQAQPGYQPPGVPDRRPSHTTQKPMPAYMQAQFRQEQLRQQEAAASAPAQPQPRMSGGSLYHQQQQAHPDQPPLMHYRKSSTSTAKPLPRIDSAMDEMDNSSFITVMSPTAGGVVGFAGRGGGVVPAVAAAADQNPRASAGSTKSSGSSATRSGGTLQDRIAALREGSVQEQHVRISVESPLVNDSYLSAAPRRSGVATGTVLSSPSSVGTDSEIGDDEFSVATRAQQVPVRQQPPVRPPQGRPRSSTADSVEF